MLGLNAQNFEWQRAFGAYTRDNMETRGLCAEANGVSTFLVNTATMVGKKTFNPDSIRFDNFVFKFPTSLDYYNKCFIVRLDSNGRTLNAKMLGNFYAYDMCKDKDGNYYLTGITTIDTMATVDSFKLHDYPSIYFYAKFDKNFNLKWMVQIDQSVNDYWQLQHLMLSEGHLYFTGAALGKSKIGLTNYNFGANYKVVLGEVNMNNGAIIWSNYLNINSSSYGYSLMKLLRLKNKLYIAGFVSSGNSNSNVLINSDSLFVSGSFVLETDTLGNYIKSFTIDNFYQSTINSITTDGKHLYLSGNFRDTLRFGNKKIIPQLTKGDGSNSNTKELYIASITTNFKTRWFYHPEILNKSNSTYFVNQITNSTFSDGFLYYGGTVGSKILIDSNTISPTYQSDVFLMKSDTLANILWATSGKSTFGEVETMDAIGGKSVFVGGRYTRQLELGKFKDTGIGLYNSFVAKITDFAIKRGNVKAGPYCAGDSIRIPYNLIGNFDSANFFIAQLSNEDGNFDKGYKELGRLKANKDGTIIGVLPMFNVVSSNKYRIRILSTKPAVQSYYRTDTLRLLIYSRDNAFAGNDTVICRGDTIAISTYGGTKWKWTPNYNMLDSNSRVAKVWPSITTRYRIVIADSSGCGAPDTAFKTIAVRESPLAKIVNADTAYCVGASIPLIAKFTNGDSLNYSWKWYSLDPLGNYTELKSASLKNVDTLLFKMPAIEKDSQKIVLYLEDGCSNIISVARYTIKINKQKPKIQLLSYDTALCPASTFAITSVFKTIVPKLNSWQWYETNFSGFFFPGVIRKNKTADTLLYTAPLNIPLNKKIRIILKDNCSEKFDTAILKIRMRDTLSLQLNTNDTTLCYGSRQLFKAKAQGGLPSAYQYEWLDVVSNKILSNSDSLNIIADSSRQIRVSVTDHCMPNNSSTLLTIKMKPALAIDAQLKDTTLCYGQNIKLKANAKGGVPANYTYQWSLNNTPFANADSVNLNTSSFASKSGSTAKLQLIISDQCSLPDTALMNLNILPAITTKIIKVDSICFNTNVLFKIQNTGGKQPYQMAWYNQSNGLLSKADSLIIQNTTLTQTGVKQLSVIVNDACSQPDTTFITTYLSAPLSYQLTSSDSCPTTTAVLNMNAKGGRGNYLVKWYVDNVYAGTSNATKLVQPKVQITQYKALIYDACSKTPDSAEIQLSLKPILHLSLKGNCLGDTSIAKVSSTLFKPTTIYQWWLNASLQNNQDSVFKITWPAVGTYQVKVSTANGTCKGSDSVTVTIVHKPKADFTYLKLTPTSTGFPFRFIDQSQQATTWTWFANNSKFSQIQNPDYTFGDTGYYKVKLRVSNNQICFDSSEKIIPVFARTQFYFPNAFSPNGNGINDGFGLSPSQYYLVKNYHLEIYNRWGERIFQTNDVKEHWLVPAPQNERQPQQGVYLFKVIITDIFDVKQEISGAVEVLR